jgi:hypothetical protein
MSLSESVKLQSVAEAKSLGSEIVDLTFVFLGIVKVLKSLETLGVDDPLLIAAAKIRDDLKSKELDGFKTPIFDPIALDMIPEFLNEIKLKELAEEILKITYQSVTTYFPREETKKQGQLINLVGGFHEIIGTRVGRLPKFITQKSDAVYFISSYLLNGESYVWDGVYNTQDPFLSTRSGNTQSMGRVFVTNLRLIFWSDDEDKPQIGVFYNDIQSWKTSWMPAKSRGVVMQVDSRKIIFVANSTAIKHATTQQGYAK